jgi:hypothetical protein
MSAIDLSELIKQGRVPKGTLLLSVEVDLTLPLSELIMRGQYDNVFEAVGTIREECFPIQFDNSTFRHRTVLLVPPYKENISIGEQAQEIRRNSLSDHLFTALFAIGEQHPEIQRIFDLFALGFFWPVNDCKLIPRLWGDQKSRNLSLLRCNLNTYKLENRHRCIAYVMEAG